MIKIKIEIRHLTRELRSLYKNEIIKEFQFNYTSSLDSSQKKKMNDLFINQNIIDFYEYSNGFDMKWIKDNEKGIKGQLSLLKMEYVLQDWSGKLYDESDLDENDLLEYYKPLDYVTPEVSSGILITPDFTSDNIYSHITGETELFDLDLNFDGYIEMAKEAKIYNLWTIVLLQIQNGKEGMETKSFKENMPSVFPDFNWDDFVKKYESLRLSKREK